MAMLPALPSLGCSRAGAAEDPLDGTIAAYQGGRRERRWSAEEATARALDRCRTIGSRWRAIDALAGRDALLAEARASDARLRSGTLRGPLDGVPVFAKSIYDMKGLPTTASSAEWARLYPEAVGRDSLEVERLRTAGAIVLGKTAADDFAYRGVGTSTHTGQVLNPHDPAGTYTPGGSSAGSAVAVAGGMAFAALGTDDGGSNRIPAVCSGVVGVKPTFGLVPRTGVIPTWPWLDTHGPLARSVQDAALMLAVIAGGDVSDPLALPIEWDGTPLRTLGTSAPSPAERRTGSPDGSSRVLQGTRLGIIEAHLPPQMSAEAVATWERAVADLRAAGAIVEPFAAPVTAENFRELFTAKARARGDVTPDPRSPVPTAVALYQYFAGRTDDPRAAIRRGYPAYQSFYDVLPESYQECEPLFELSMMEDPAARSFGRSRVEVVIALEQAMLAAGVSALVYPTMPHNAFRLAEGWPDMRDPLGYGNWLGLPEVSVPAGMGADGLPALNLSIVGLPGEDLRALELAHAYEQQSRRFVAPTGT